VKVINSAPELRAELEIARKKSRVGFVPTMGYLHQGHLSLVDIAKQKANFVVVSIFVNPMQFNNSEDFQKYPINIERDLELLQSRNIDLVYIPTVSDIYPNKVKVTLNPGELAAQFEGEFRPGHFEGVLTVVSILFNQVQPDLAVFGEKDFQQLTLIRKMVSDLQFPIEIIEGPIVREESGLAMSSRNSRLSEDGKKQAKALSFLLETFFKTLSEGNNSNLRDLKKLSINKTKDYYPAFDLEYFEIVNQDTLEKFPDDSKSSEILINSPRGLVAGYIEGVRLIDTAGF
jgi:pantoate--beta-alanine ligase